MIQPGSVWLRRLWGELLDQGHESIVNTQPGTGLPGGVALVDEDKHGEIDFRGQPCIAMPESVVAFAYENTSGIARPVTMRPGIV